MIKSIRIVFSAIALGSILYSCSGNDEKNNIVWAGLVESKTNVIKPEGFQDEYWRSINQNTDYSKIFNTIVESVLKGEKKAYDIFSDQELSIAEVQNLIGFDGNIKDKVTIFNLSALRMREEWIFNEKDFSITKKVKRVDLLLKKEDPTTGEYLGDKALFYIKLDE